MNIKRMQVWYADMSPVVGSEQGGYRAVVIVSNDIGNKYSPVVIAAPITSKINKKRLPTQIDLKAQYGTIVDSMIECEQIRTMDKKRLKKYLFEITEPQIVAAINQAIKVSFGI